MTIDINELRRLAQAAMPGPDGVSLSWIRLLRDFQQGASPAAVSELLDRFEAAEKDVTLKERVIDALGSELNAVANERDALRAKIEQMERQESVAKVPSVPEKVEVREDEGMIFSRGSYNEGYDNGWNDCIDAMLASLEAKP